MATHRKLLGRVLLALSVLTISQHCEATCNDKELQNDKTLTERLDDFLREFMECRQVPGLSLAIVKHNRTLLSKGYGYASLEQKISVTQDTIFSIASLSKAFTAILLGKLLTENGYDYDSSINSILKKKIEFPDDYITSHVTVRDLLSHRTGIPRYDMMWLTGAMNRTEMFRSIKCMTSEGFRENVVYNNIMYELAGHVAEVLGNATWRDLVQKHILRPLGMNSTTFWSHRLQTNNMASKYSYSSGEGFKRIGLDKFQGASNIEAAIGLMSSASDMTKWLKFLLEPDQPLHSIVALTMAPSVAIKDTPFMLVNEFRRPIATLPHIYEKYGMAWFLGSYRSYETAMHYGSFIGYYSQITLVPRLGIGIYSAINGGLQISPYNINSLLHTYALDLLMGHVPWLASPEACKYNLDLSSFNATEDINKTRSPSHSPADYAGAYYHTVFGTLRVSADNDTLHLTYGDIVFNMFFLESAESDVFIIAPTEKDWRIWSVEVKFHFSNSIVESVEVPFEYTMRNNFIKIPEDDDLPNWNKNEGSRCYEEPWESIGSNSALVKPHILLIYLYIMFLFIRK